MTIGIDIDDTIVDTDKFICRMINDVFRHKGRTSLKYDIDFSHYISDNIEYIFKNAPVKKKAKEVIKYLKENGHVIYIITARSNDISENVQDITLEYLKKNEIEYDKIIFGCAQKRNICIDNDIDIMIDDNSDLMLSLIGTNIVGIHFSTESNYSTIHESASNWNEVKKIIDLGGYNGKKSIVKRRSFRRRF